MIKPRTRFFLLFLTENWVAQIGRGLVFSADLCYNGMGDENGEQKGIAEKKRYSPKEL